MIDTKHCLRLTNDIDPAKCEGRVSTIQAITGFTRDCTLDCMSCGLPIVTGTLNDADDLKLADKIVERIAMNPGLYDLSGRPLPKGALYEELQASAQLDVPQKETVGPISPDLTPREIGALVAMYSVSMTHHVMFPNLRWDELVVIWRDLALRGLIIETSTPKGPDFALSGAGRKIVIRHLFGSADRL